MPAPKGHKGGFWVSCLGDQRMQEQNGHCLTSWVPRELALYWLPGDSHGSCWLMAARRGDTGHRMAKAPWGWQQSLPYNTAQAHGLSPLFP